MGSNERPWSPQGCGETPAGAYSSAPSAEPLGALAGFERASPSGEPRGALACFDSEGAQDGPKSSLHSCSNISTPGNAPIKDGRAGLVDQGAIVGLLIICTFL